MRALFAALGLIVAFSAIPRADADTLYAVDVSDNLYTVGAGGAVSYVGTIPAAGTAFPYGLEFYGGSLWTFDQTNDQILEIDPSDASILSTIATSNLVGEGSIAIDALGNGYLTSSSGATGTLYGFDAKNGTWGGYIADLRVSIDGSDFSPTNGRLYGSSQDNADLYLINPLTGGLTFIGSIGNLSDNNTVSGLTFRSDGTLWGEVADNLYTIDPSNANVTLQSVINGQRDDISGLSYSSGVPEPGLMLLASGAFAGVIWRRRRRRAA